MEVATEFALLAHTFHGAHNGTVHHECTDILTFGFFDEFPARSRVP
jgi:hypothetical protein